jgi:Tol biopolymer transport system component
MREGTVLVRSPPRGRDRTYRWRRSARSLASTCSAATGLLLLLAGAAAAPGDPIPDRDIRRDNVNAQGWSSDGVVFVRYFDRQKNSDSYEIAVVSFDGRKRQVIGGGGPTCAIEASVSRDGSQIAFPAEVDYSADTDSWYCDIFLGRSDGSDIRNVTNTPISLGRGYQEFAPKWAPDGTAIAYERDAEKFNHDLVVLEFASGSTHVVGRGTNPIWSPDSRRLAFSSFLSQRNSAIVSVARDGSDLRRLTTAAGWVAAGWSPDGRRLLVERQPTALRSTIWTMNIDGSGKRRLARGHHAQWAPRGDWIAFVRSRRPDLDLQYPYGFGYDSLFVVRADGTGLRRLATVYGTGHVWAPDGRRLAVARKIRCLHSGIYIVDLQGRSRSLTNDCRIRGTTRDDVLVGTEEPDLVWALGGSDRIDTNPGDRWQYGWGGDADIVWAGAGNDVVRTGPSRDTIYGGLGADRIAGGDEADLLLGGKGNDILRGGNNRDHIDGGAGRDRLFGDKHADVLRTRDGEVDTVVCGSGRDRVFADSLDAISPDCEVVARSSGKR